LILSQNPGAVPVDTKPSRLKIGVIAPSAEQLTAAKLRWNELFPNYSTLAHELSTIMKYHDIAVRDNAMYLDQITDLKEDIVRLTKALAVEGKLKIPVLMLDKIST
jgi:hypothetical protein